MELLLIIAAFLLASLIGAAQKNRKITEFATLIACGIAVAVSIMTALKVSDSGTYSPFSFLSVDSIGAILMLIISCVGFFTAIYSIQSLREETNQKILGLARVRQYFSLLNIFLLAMFFAIMASNPIIVWISIEATTLSTAFLISFYDKPDSMEAAWKYLIINSVGLLIGFFGTLLYLTAVKSMEGGAFISWQMLMDNAAHMDPMVAKIAFIFVLVGYGTKVGLAPMHTWLPDAHSKAPAPISALLSGVLLNVALIAVLRFKAITDLAIGNLFSQKILIVFGLISIIIAVLIIFAQKNYKRLLAYSSIENMGLMAVGFGFGGVAASAAILHMIYHSLVKSALFLSAGNILLKYGSTKIAKVRGVLSALPVTGVLFFVGFFAIVGTPPFGMFMTKMLILSEGIKINPFVSGAILLLTAILFVGFFRHVVSLLFGEKPADLKKGEVSVWLVVSPLALIALALYLSFAMPPFLSNLVNDIVSHY
jgi:hydrogenase-4 component F